jgi:hypothetical protein
MKDPILQTYSFEELAYEFHSVREHKKVQVEYTEQETDKIEEDKDKQAQEWADQMEAEEAAEQLKAQDPLKDPSNIKWMEEQIAKHKEEFGEDFGDDVSLDFNTSTNQED